VVVAVVAVVLAEPQAAEMAAGRIRPFMAAQGVSASCASRSDSRISRPAAAPLLHPTTTSSRSR
jgi:hypothetical protein